ncbi:MAG: undecaprenyl/decaprenyl-phosphate alpha-N-acetylglucosaminyl 1-phosphate transferase [bacterium]|nr:undecaprenyl/decaprenyl-phosphate alpha-N-acetylglucosaminyl 1-phosphate transferase [bacterium]
MFVYWIVGLTAFLAALVATPFAARAARAMGWFDHPGGRKMHGRPVAYLGGAAVFVACSIGLASLVFLVPEPVAALLALEPEMLALILGAGLMFSVGLLDDVLLVRPRTKFVAQVAAALIAYASGIRIETIHVSDELVLEFGPLSAVVTALWIVGITNAVNLIDGLNGLAAGLALIACVAIGWVAHMAGLTATAILLVAMLGALSGFLPYNLKPARIFLGDAGSMMLGFLLASTAVIAAAKTATIVGVGLPIIALGIPILDTLFSMLRRVLEGRSPFSADRNHIHHRLLALGFDQTRIVLLLCAETAAAVVLAIHFSSSGSTVRNLGFLGLLGLHLVVFRFAGAVRLRDSLRSFRRSRAVPATDGPDLGTLELHLREATTIAAWWDAVTAIGARLGCRQLELRLGPRRGGPRTLTWSAGPAHGRSDGPAMTLPIEASSAAGDEPLTLRVVFAGHVALESAGVHLTQLGGLLDRYGAAPVVSAGEIDPAAQPGPAFGR